MLIASFADPGAADALAARYPDGIWRPVPGLLVWRGNALWPEVPAPLLGLQGSIVDRRTGRLLDAGAVANAVAKSGDSAIDDWAPAFRIAWLKDNKASVAADHCGLGHWYGWSSDGVAVLSDRAATIARHFGLDINTAAFGGLALTGAMVGLDSAVSGVTKLAIGQIASVEHGKLHFRAMGAPGRFAETAEAIPATMTRLLAAHPTAEIELSGGWDSRMMLAGLPRAARKGLPGFTIGSADDPDVVIARLLANDGAMPHSIVDLSTLAALAPADFVAQLADAAVRDDFGGNPLDRVGLNLINAGRPPRPRFSGQNGEILRGFYYPGQPLGAPASPTLAARVINWRIISNDLVDSTMFDPTWLADTRSVIVSRLERLLLDHAGQWGDALDRFYLEQRMHRWCGAAISATLGRRPVLLPFFDPDVLALAAATAPSAKAGSRFAASEILRLDAGLASIPLASRLIPEQIARGGLAGRLSSARQFVGKATAKVMQQLARRDASTSRSVAAGTLAVRHGMPARVDIDRLAQLGMFAPQSLDAFQRGEKGMDRSTMGFLFNIDTFLTSITEPRL